MNKGQGTYNQLSGQEQEQVCIRALWTLKSQVCWLGGQPMRWHGWCVVVQSSCDGHMTREGPKLSEAMGVPSDQGSSCTV